MRMFWFSALLACSLLPLVGGEAAGKGEEKAGTKDDATLAREHYKRGTTLYDLNRFEEAVKEFEAAYEIKDDPVLLYNIAQSYRLANKYPEALRFYRNYLRRSPKAPNKIEVEQKIADMEKLITEQNRVATAAPDTMIAPGTRPPQSAAPTTAPVTPPTTGGTQVASATQPERRTPVAPEPTVTEPPERPAVTAAPLEPEPVTPAKRSGNPGRTKLIAGIVVAVAGLAAVGAGVAFGLMAQGAASDQADPVKTPKFDPALESKGNTDSNIAIGLFAGGGALVAVGVGIAVWGAVQKRDTSAASSYLRHVQLAPSVSHNYAGGALRLEF